MPGRKKFCPICLQEWEGEDGFCRTCGVQLVRSDPEDITGFLVDRKYRVDAIIARGGMGVVYRATQVYLNREVALKVLRADLPKDANATRRFLLEARAASSLRSPHTVTVHDFGISDDGRLYFAMELLDGEPLDRLLARGPLPWQRVVGIILQVCDSLGEAHAQRIFHRDIKPANIFLARTTGGTDFVKVLDFGIARIGEETGLTKPGGLCGTPEYASPEQAIGGEADLRSDLYSLGVVAYEMLSGRKPFDGVGPKILMAHVREKPQPLASCCPEGSVPPPLDEVIQCMLEKLPSRRPQSTTELAEALHRLAANQGISLHLAVPVLARSEQKPPAGDTPLPTPLKSILGNKKDSGQPNGTIEEELNEIIDAKVADVQEAPTPPPVSPRKEESDEGDFSVAALPGSSAVRRGLLAAIGAGTGLLVGLLAWILWPSATMPPSDSSQDAAPATAVAAGSTDVSHSQPDDSTPVRRDVVQPDVAPPAETPTNWASWGLPDTGPLGRGGRLAVSLMLSETARRAQELASADPATQGVAAPPVNGEAGSPLAEGASRPSVEAASPMDQGTVQKTVEAAKTVDQGAVQKTVEAVKTVDRKATQKAAAAGKPRGQDAGGISAESKLEGQQKGPPDSGVSDGGTTESSAPKLAGGTEASGDPASTKGAGKEPDEEYGIIPEE